MGESDQGANKSRRINILAGKNRRRLENPASILIKSVEHPELVSHKCWKLFNLFVISVEGFIEGSRYFEDTWVYRMRVWRYAELTGNYKLSHTDPVAVVDASAPVPVETQMKISDAGNICNAGGLQKSAWNKSSDNGVGEEIRLCCGRN
ncbi:hypothetical protein E3N88_43639 [Mikania micrantha]|uniref:Uncharacterized protein n=1 Tax=Mikania micrantha TaxID=192012 RepID=A0A5N6LF25_9ASTR|nr:hypothetical protein E3N88_43639 [Mikania micrantha]